MANFPSGKSSPGRQAPHRQGELPRPGEGGQVLVQGGGQALLPEHGLEGLGLAPVGGEDHHGKALFWYWVRSSTRVSKRMP